MVMRFHEYAGAKGRACIRFGFPVKEVRQCDLMERPDDREETLSQNTLHIKIKPYEIITLLVKI